MNRPASSLSDVELLARAACRHEGGCCGDCGNGCVAMFMFGALATAQFAALRASHRLIASPHQGKRAGPVEAHLRMGAP